MGNRRGRRSVGMRAGAAARFLRDESGALAVWSLYMFLMVILLGAAGVDLMLNEMRRTQLQATLDRAVLAAADLDQEGEPAEVVASYFEAAGLGDHLAEITVDEGLNYRSVSARAERETKTLLLRAMGVDTLKATALSTAEEAVNDIEISMVLDISGSMGSNGKLRNLKDAGTEFVDTIFSNSIPGRTSISIVPYSTQVNAGPALLSTMNVQDSHDHSHCVDFASGDYDDIVLDPAAGWTQAGHFDPFYPYNYGRGPFRFVCRPETSAQIMPLSGRAADLNDRIESFTADGNTSIEIGVKWGAALLDPSMRGAVSDLVDAGEVPGDFAGRPLDHDAENVLKVMVVMTDGVNTTQFQLRDEYRSGPSDFWIDPDTGRVSFRTVQEDGGDCGWQRISGRWYWICEESDEPRYYTPHDDSWQDEPYGGSDAYRMDYSELWSEMTVSYHAYARYLANRDADEYYDWDNEPYSAVGPSAKDERLSRICRAARDAGIIVYTIGFEVTQHSADVLRDCASSPSHFYLVEGIEITDAFQAIARQIDQLKLTQ